MIKIHKLLLITSILGIGVITSVFAQPNWKRTNYETSTVFTGFVKIRGENAHPNDMVAVFVNGECRMSAKIIIVNDSTFVSAVIHSSGKPEVATIKYWDSQENKVYDIDTTIAIGNHETVKRFPIELKSGTATEDPTPIVKIEDKLEVYPSPFSSNITIESTKSIKKIVLYNNIGKLLKTVESGLQSNITSIETSTLSVGMYLISIEFTDGSVVTKKIFKK